MGCSHPKPLPETTAGCSFRANSLRVEKKIFPVQYRTWKNLYIHNLSRTFLEKRQLPAGLELLCITDYEAGAEYDLPLPNTIKYLKIIAWSAKTIFLPCLPESIEEIQLVSNTPIDQVILPRKPLLNLRVLVVSNKIRIRNPHVLLKCTKLEMLRINTDGLEELEQHLQNTCNLQKTHSRFYQSSIWLSKELKNGLIKPYHRSRDNILTFIDMEEWKNEEQSSGSESVLKSQIKTKSALTAPIPPPPIAPQAV